jgi:hypothetical protein
LVPIRTKVSLAFGDFVGEDLFDGFFDGVLAGLAPKDEHRRAQLASTAVAVATAV